MINTQNTEKHGDNTGGYALNEGRIIVAKIKVIMRC